MSSWFQRLWFPTNQVYDDIKRLCASVWWVHHFDIVFLKLATEWIDHWGQWLNATCIALVASWWPGPVYGHELVNEFQLFWFPTNVFDDLKRVYALDWCVHPLNVAFFNLATKWIGHLGQWLSAACMARPPVYILICRTRVVKRIPTSFSQLQPPSLGTSSGCAHQSGAYIRLTSFS